MSSHIFKKNAYETISIASFIKNMNACGQKCAVDGLGRALLHLLDVDSLTKVVCAFKNSPLHRMFIVENVFFPFRPLAILL